MTLRLIVTGGDAAGMSAASAARGQKGPEEPAIVAFDRSNYTSYSPAASVLHRQRCPRCPRLEVGRKESYGWWPDRPWRLRHWFTGTGGCLNGTLVQHPCLPDEGRAAPGPG